MYIYTFSFIIIVLLQYGTTLALLKTATIYDVNEKPHYIATAAKLYYIISSIPTIYVHIFHSSVIINNTIHS